MSDYSQLVPEHLRTLGGYAAGKSRSQAQKESHVICIKLASNENPFGASPLAVQAMQAVLSEVNFYPDNDASDLRDQLAALHQVRHEQLVVTNGSTSLLGIMARTLLAPGLNAVTSDRSFIVYPIATKAAGGTLITVPTRNDGFDLDAIAAAINEDTRLVFISNPNNPTGTLVSADEVDRFLDKVPGRVVVVLDEAYCDFAEAFARQRGVHYSRSLEYVRQGRNVVILRTFSKAHGLAGIRVGYGIGPAELMAYFARMRTTFSVSLPAQAAALAALQDEAHVRNAVANNTAESERLMNGLKEMGYHPVQTWANFIFCDIGEDATVVSKRMQAEGIIIRPLGPWGIADAIRISIGTPSQNEACLQAFRKVMEKQAVS
ncbi:MAG: histidinol-phosphate transaminase [Acidobacteriales bacterium]|nr:histidinol-phosphate transaminase [Terriglobales bacterium]